MKKCINYIKLLKLIDLSILEGNRIIGVTVKCFDTDRKAIGEDDFL